MIRRTDPQLHPRHALVLGLLTLVYFVAGRVGLSLAFVHESASAVWPPTGIAIAALLLLGMRTWPAIAAGAFLVNVTTSGAIVASLAIAAGNTLEGVAGAWLVTRFAGGVAAFDRPADILRFTLAAGMGATAIAATIGATTLLVSGLAAARDTPSIWFTWWLGDAVGAVVIAPLLLLWSRRSRTAGVRGSRAEAAALAVSLIAVSATVFGVWTPGESNYPLQFLVAPILLWAAFRFGGRETATVSAVLAAIAIYGTLGGFGPFARASPNESLLLLQGFIGVTTVVMLAVAAEVEVRRAIEMEIRSLNEAKDRFLAVLSHELRTPLNAAVGWAHTLIELPPHEPRTVRAVDAIYRNLLIQSRLVSDIMDVSRIARGHLSLDRKPVDLARVIETSIDMLRAVAEARRITISVQIAPEPPLVIGDSKRLVQVFSNLLSNAVKFGREGGQVRIELTRDAGAVELSVKDDGTGIDPAFLPHLFEPFRQADASMKREHEGLGLGLAIAANIVEAHGGTLTAANAPGGGAVFTVRLPSQSA